MTRKLIPNSTQIPDMILDEWMPKLAPSEFVIVMFIARKTYGWGKASDELSRSQIQESTGLGKSAVDEALSRLSADNGPIIRTLSTLPAGHPRAWSIYSINVDWEGDLPDIRKRSNAQPSRRGGTPATAGIPPNECQPSRRLDSNPPATAGTTRDTVTRDTIQETGTAFPQAEKSPVSSFIPRTKQRRKPQPPDLTDEQVRFFTSWYDRYPNKVDKQAAIKAWANLSPDADTIAQMAEGFKRWQSSSQWAEGAIQHPATWLNKKAWEDFPVAAKPLGGKSTSLTGPSPEKSTMYREFNPNDD